MKLSEQIMWVDKEIKAARDCQAISQRFDGDPTEYWGKERIAPLEAIKATLEEISQAKAYGES